MTIAANRVRLERLERARAAETRELYVRFFSARHAVPESKTRRLLADAEAWLRGGGETAAGPARTAEFEAWAAEEAKLWPAAFEEWRRTGRVEVRPIPAPHPPAETAEVRVRMLRNDLYARVRYPFVEPADERLAVWNAQIADLGLGPEDVSAALRGLLENFRPEPGSVERLLDLGNDGLLRLLAEGVRWPGAPLHDGRLGFVIDGLAARAVGKDG